LEGSVRRGKKGAKLQENMHPGKEKGEGGGYQRESIIYEEKTINQKEKKGWGTVKYRPNPDW